MLRSQIERLFDAPALQYAEADYKLFQEFKDGLNRGEIRAAEPDPAAKSGWRANAWVKKGILLGFRMGRVVDFSLHGETNKRQLFFFDKSTYPVRPMSAEDGVRLVPGGSSTPPICAPAEMWQFRPICAQLPTSACESIMVCSSRYAPTLMNIGGMQTTPRAM